jgi:hypothetical protein
MDDRTTKAILAAAATVAGALGVALAQYAVTSHGANPWTIEAALNVLRIQPWIERARALVGGKINSAYRHPTINAAIGGSPTSAHMLGLAVDLAPTGATDTAARLLWSAAKSGALGPVDQIIDERTWVHIGWRKPGTTRPMQLMRKDGDTFTTIETSPQVKA